MESIEVMPIRVRVTAILRKALLAGEYPAGSELSLTEVSEKLGVSRTPVREAFQTLAAEGLLKLRMNRGAMVTGMNEKFILDHFELRSILETQALRLAMVRKLNAAELQEIQATALGAPLSEEQYRSYNQRFHTAIWQGADNERLFRLLESLWNGPSARGFGNDPEHETLSIREHSLILQAIQAQDTEAAVRWMEQHLSRSRDNILSTFHGHEIRNGEKETL